MGLQAAAEANVIRTGHDFYSTVVVMVALARCRATKPICRFGRRRLSVPVLSFRKALGWGSVGWGGEWGRKEGGGRRLAQSTESFVSDGALEG
jgi:hypothetical protein